MDVALNRIHIIFFALALAVWASTPAWSAENKALVSFLEGSAFKSRTGKDWEAVSKGDVLTGEDQVKTGAKSKIELTLPDGSKIRFSENTSVKIQSILSDEEKRDFEFKVFFGKIWSKAAKFKKTSKFDIKTANAVAGVKGTTYRIDANKDKSSIVRVYEGEVSVSNLPPGKVGKSQSKTPKYVSGPTEIPGPHEITREEWTYIVKSWQQIAISPSGVASKPVSFTPEEDKSDWVLWNQEMDTKQP